jgi:carboxypeptidase family protein
MRRTFFCITILLLALVSVRGVNAAPQRRGTGTATLNGVVLGPDDKPVAHAAVTYQSSGGNAPHAVHADSQGRFTISKLKADNYDMRASGKGVFSEWEKNITVHSGQTKTVTLRLIYAREVPKAYVKTKPQQ